MTKKRPPAPADEDAAESLDRRLDTLLNTTLGTDLPGRLAFEKLCALKPGRNHPHPYTRDCSVGHRQQLRFWVLALDEALALKGPENQSRRLGISQKARSTLSQRLQSIAAEVEAVNRGSASPVDLLGERAKRKSQEPGMEPESLALSSRAESFDNLPRVMRAYADVLDAKNEDAFSIPSTAQTVGLLRYVAGWSGTPHYREVAAIVLHLEEGSAPADPALRLRQKITTLEKLLRKAGDCKIAVPLSPSL